MTTQIQHLPQQQQQLQQPQPKSGPNLDDFNIITKLGTGSYSEVFKVARKTDNQFYALKKVSLDNLSQKERENALNEVRILASIQHENIIGYKESFIDQGKTLCIVMDYASDGDLYQKIVKNKKEKTNFSEDLVWKILIGAVQALACFHDLKIFHRDIKSANIFLNKNGTAVLGDLNVSKVAKQGLLYTQTGTPYYASPEVWKDQPYDSKSDIWSLGCVFYEVLTLVPPFRAKDMNGLFKKVTQGVFDEPPKIYSADLIKLITSMIKVNPKDRPSCDQILRTPEISQKMKQLKMIRLNKEAMREERRPSLLQTIKLPKNLKNLTERLPKAQYENSPDPIRVLSARNSPQTPPEKNLDQNGDELLPRRKRKRSVAPQKSQSPDISKEVVGKENEEMQKAIVPQSYDRVATRGKRDLSSRINRNQSQDLVLPQLITNERSVPKVKSYKDINNENDIKSDVVVLPSIASIKEVSNPRRIENISPNKDTLEQGEPKHILNLKQKQTPLPIINSKSDLTTPYAQVQRREPQQLQKHSLLDNHGLVMPQQQPERNPETRHQRARTEISPKPAVKEMQENQDKEQAAYLEQLKAIQAPAPSRRQRIVTTDSKQGQDEKLGVKEIESAQKREPSLMQKRSESSLKKEHPVQLIQNQQPLPKSSRQDNQNQQPPPKSSRQENEKVYKPILIHQKERIIPVEINLSAGLNVQRQGTESQVEQISERYPMTKRQEAIRAILDVQRQRENVKIEHQKQKEKEKLEDLLRMRGIRHSVVAEIEQKRLQSLEQKSLNPQPATQPVRSLSPAHIGQIEITPVVEKPNKNQQQSVADVKSKVFQLRKPTLIPILQSPYLQPQPLSTKNIHASQLPPMQAYRQETSYTPSTNILRRRESALIPITEQNRLAQLLQVPTEKTRIHQLRLQAYPSPSRGEIQSQDGSNQVKGVSLQNNPIIAQNIAINILRQPSALKAQADRQMRIEERLRAMYNPEIKPTSLVQALRQRNRLNSEQVPNTSGISKNPPVSVNALRQ